MANQLNIKQTAFVAAYLGEANGNATEAARIAGYKGNDTTLGAVGAENLKKPLIAAAIAAARAEIKQTGIAVQQARIDAADDRWQRMRQLITERAGDPNMRGIPGGTTGLLVHTTKAIGAGRTQQLIDEYQFDAALMREARELEKHVSEELGQRTSNINLTGAITFADLFKLATTDASADDSQPGQ